MNRTVTKSASTSCRGRVRTTLLLPCHERQGKRSFHAAREIDTAPLLVSGHKPIIFCGACSVGNHDIGKPIEIL